VNEAWEPGRVFLAKRTQFHSPTTPSAVHGLPHSFGFSNLEAPGNQQQRQWLRFQARKPRCATLSPRGQYSGLIRR
jgi:hypothetical protein